MLRPIITPSHTAVTLAPGSARRMGAMIGTTTTAISMKSRKKPSRKITAITTTNWAQKPPGSPVRKCRTSSSPPKARNAEVSIAAPIRMMNTIEVVFAVSIITPRRVSSMRQARQALHATPTSSPATATPASAMPSASRSSRMFLMLRSKTDSTAMMPAVDSAARIAG